MSKRLPVLKEPIPGRICWVCAHVSYQPGSPGYSELTPGWNFSLSCGKDYWDFDNDDDDLQAFREKLMSAERCADFEEHPDIIALRRGH